MSESKSKRFIGGCAPHFPTTRLRRMRYDDFSRRLVSETRLHSDDLIYPIFITEGTAVREPVLSMPNIDRISIDILLEEARQLEDLQLPAVALFPVIAEDKRSVDASEAWHPKGLVQTAVMSLKREVPTLGVITDVALDPYTVHGHDGLVDANGHIINDGTVEALIKQACSHATAGADIVAPSDMMDGRVGAIRHALDEAGYTHTRILAYAAKYASAFYGPFRDAVKSSAMLGDGDKKTYQMDPANSNEALREVQLDINEGADLVMVKPGLAYLDIIHRIKHTFGVPTLAYQVSGEYAMLKAAAEKGWLDERATVMESLIACKRAGADAILTYYAKQVAKWLQAR